jgi:uncharacterized protein (TIGR02145 family)
VDPSSGSLTLGGTATDVPTTTPMTNFGYAVGLQTSLSAQNSFQFDNFSIKLNNLPGSLTPAPTTSSNQIFCNGASVANLQSQGTNLKWYASATGGLVLASDVALTSGNYYVSQTIDAVESSRTITLVTLNDSQITASANNVCSGTPVTITASTNSVGTSTLPANLQNGLVGYWPFNGNANDASGNNNNGTVNGATLTTDRYGNANSNYTFGQGKFIRTNSIIPNCKNNFSFSTWVNPSSLITVPSENTLVSAPNQCVIHPTHGSCFGPESTNSGAGLYVGTNGIVVIEHSHVYVRTALVYGGSITDWNLITVVYENKVPKLYINGQYIKTGIADVRDVHASSGFDNTTFANYSNSGFGASFNGPTNQGIFFDGQIDDISIWNRTLSTSEIAQLYTPPTTYLWSTGETTATINPTPRATTTYWCDITVNGVTCRKEITITVLPITIPTFTLIASTCAGTNLTALPTTSTNGITGTWSPALNNNQTTTYTFTPDAGQCAATTTQTITVNPFPVAPSVSSTQTFCTGSSPTVASLSASGTNIQWYSTASGGTALTTSTILSSGTYYASQTMGTTSVPANGLLAYWGFNGNANDSSGNNNNGIVNGATLTTDRFGNANAAYNFDGISNSISVPANENFTQNPISYSFWFNKAGSGNPCNGNEAFEVIFSTGSYSQSRDVTLAQGTPHYMGIFRSIPSGCEDQLTQQANYTLNTWNHAVVIYEANLVKVYFNGDYIGSTPFTCSPYSANTTCYIGASNPSIWACIAYFNGKIDDLAIYNRVLSDTEVLNLYNGNIEYSCESPRSEVAVTITPQVTPIFTPIASSCLGETINPLPTTSTNGVTGTWSPAINNNETTTYTFTPNGGQCINTTTMTIIVNPTIIPTFTEIGSVCIGIPLAPLPTTSINGITGTWSPAINSNATTTYTFTPYAGQCATNTMQTITVLVPLESSPISFLSPPVGIGSQMWTSTNLEVTTYCDGTPIPQVTDPVAWANLTTGAWCYYNNDPSKGSVYGKLYNWYAVAGIHDELSKTNSTKRKKLAPIGWHVPTDTEWSTLTTSLGGENTAGSAMKELGFNHWSPSNTDATNTSNFAGLPGGCRFFGSFTTLGNYGFWWSFSDTFPKLGGSVSLSHSLGSVNKTINDKTLGFSVRCVKD